MKFVNSCLLFLLLILSVSANAQRLFKGQVTDVIDGKTLIIATGTNAKVTVQLPFIEVPENNQPLTDVVKNHLRQIAFDQKVDYYATGLTSSTIVFAKVFVNGTDLSQQMIRDGAAWYNLPEDGLYAQNDRELYKNTEILARNEKRGVWGVDGLKPSWEYRAELEAKRLEEEKLAEKEAQLAQAAREKEIAQKKSSRQTEEDRRKANENVQVWVDVFSDSNGKDYVITYDSTKNATSLKSQTITLLSPELPNTDSLSLNFTHSFAGKDAKKTTEDYYFFELTFRSETIDLSSAKKGNKLVFSIGQNKYTLEFLNYKTGKVPDPKDKTGKTLCKSQTLTFKMSKKDFQKFSEATEIDFDVNAFTGTIAGTELDIIKRVP
jgi:endonuclease YncB( thermonuclease family)